MKNRQLGLNGYRILFVAITLVAVVPLAAQGQKLYDFQIMVNGPWDYVLDPEPERNGGPPEDDRIVLVAPAMHIAGMKAVHSASIFWGRDATVENPPSIPVNPSEHGKLALYYVDFNRIAPNLDRTVNTEEPPKLYHPQQSVSLARIRHILYDDSVARYAISLPMPDYVSTYTGEYGTGFAESKISTGNVTNGMPPQNYTIWMVLHYTTSVQSPPFYQRVDDGPSSVLKNKAEIPKTGIPPDELDGLSIRLAEDLQDYNDPCDAVSGESFSDSMQMWHLPEHARFPVVRDGISGGQYPGYYDYVNCDESHGLNVELMSRKVQATRAKNDKLVKEVETLRAKLAHAGSGTSVADFKGVEDDLGASLGPGVSAREKNAMKCAKSLIAHQEQQGCPAKLTSEVFDEYFGDGKGKMGLLSVGRADCHKAQISINGVLP